MQTYFDCRKLLPDRPGLGNCGQRVLIKVNCWDLSMKDVPVNQYDLQLLELSSGSKTLEIDEKHLRKKHLPKVIDRYTLIVHPRMPILNL